MDKQISTESLKPCPFCGSPASVHVQFQRDYWIQCENLTDCGATDGMLYTEPRKAITAWNRRAQPTHQPDTVELGGIKFGLTPPDSNEQAAPQQDECGGCNSTGWTVRDPDIGTDQECFVCEGSGRYEDAAQSVQDKPQEAGQAAPSVPEGYERVPSDPQIAELAVQVGLPYGPDTWHALREFAHYVPTLTAAAPSPAVKHSLTTEAQAAPEVDARDAERLDRLIKEMYCLPNHEELFKGERVVLCIAGDVPFDHVREVIDAALSAQSVSLDGKAGV